MSTKMNIVFSRCFTEVVFLMGLLLADFILDLDLGLLTYFIHISLKVLVFQHFYHTVSTFYACI